MNSVNLVNTKLVHKIFCNCPQRDGFEVENLVENSSSNSGFQFFSNSTNKGFVVEAFIRGPVSIYILFKESIQIDSVLIDAKVNTQLSSGFQLSSSIDPIEHLDSADRREKYMNGFCQIAKIINEKNKQSHVYEFLRRGHNSDDANSSASSRNRCFFGSRNLAFLNCPNAIRIDIIRTLNSSSACIKSIQVFGKLANGGAVVVDTSPKNKETSNHQVEIPSEFIDELTHELMRLPIKLPSQKYIDKSTLDRYVSEKEKSYEAVVDPFTRVPFSHGHKPIIDDELKSRIDKFLFDNRTAASFVVTPQVSSRSTTEVRKRPQEASSSSASASLQRSSKRLKNDQERLFVCSLCLNKKKPTSSLPFYRLDSCGHVHCRTCLLAIENVCSKCKKSFRNAQVTNVDTV